MTDQQIKEYDANWMAREADVILRREEVRASIVVLHVDDIAFMEDSIKLLKVIKFDIVNKYIEMTEFKGFRASAVFLFISNCEKDRIILGSDILFFGCLFLTRGTNIKPKLSKMEPRTASKIRNLYAKYHVEDRLPEASQPDTVTLSRIIACFPIVVMEICI